MEVGNRIKELRTEAGMSQDALAERVYVSRQTISSWEHSKTYPDIQSLLLLSEIFDVTVDSLIKGDVETMTNAIEHDARIMKRLGWTMTCCLALMIAVVIWLAVQLVVWDWPLAQTVPTALLAVVIWGIALFAAAWSERIKREHDLMTYQEVLAFWNGEAIERDTERRRRESLIPRWMKIIRFAGTIVIALAIGWFLGYFGSMALDAFFG